jgi:hypothetical protein
MNRMTKTKILIEKLWLIQSVSQAPRHECRLATSRGKENTKHSTRDLQFIIYNRFWREHLNQRNSFTTLSLQHNCFLSHSHSECNVFQNFKASWPYLSTFAHQTKQPYFLYSRDYITTQVQLYWLCSVELNEDVNTNYQTMKIRKKIIGIFMAVKIHIDLLDNYTLHINAVCPSETSVST